MPLQVAPSEEVHELVRRVSLLNDAVVDVDHLLRVDFDVKLGCFSFFALVIERPIEID